ncbi:MAG: hypothetical protein GY866_27065 [Proteobacteria bacterium]|nr:hypothetical protein [Pseudomonadota bacterium]
MKPYHIVFTTINHPYVLNDLFDNIAQYDHLSSVKVWVVGDKRTPNTCGELAEEITKKGLETVYLDIPQQDEWGKRCYDFYRRIPYNNETRRNIGYLCALEDGCEIMISIDDDNFPTEDDFVGCHIQTGSPWEGGLLKEESGFHNLCEYLEISPSRPVFPRGFPFRLRGTPNQPQEIRGGGSVRIGVTAGLWLADPDIDATTWLNGKVTGTAYRGADLQVLDPSTWTPINTQNTSIVRELIPAFLCIPMGWDVPGGKIQRYGDIWGGYFLQALMQESEYVAAFGRPIVEHRRNPHDYVDDLRFEYWGMILTDWLLKTVRADFVPVSAGIADRVDELAAFLQDKAIPTMPDWCPKEIQDFMLWTEGNLRTWAAACRTFI